MHANLRRWISKYRDAVFLHPNGLAMTGGSVNTDNYRWLVGASWDMGKKLGSHVLMRCMC